MTQVRRTAFYFFVIGVFGAAPYFSLKYIFNPSVEIAFNDRAPSSIQKVYDYSHLVGNALEAAAQTRLSNSIDIAYTNGEVNLQMGNFVLLNEEKQKEFACGFYDRIQFVFEAEGVAVAGEKPVLSVSSECDVASNINMMTTIKLPLGELIKQKPGTSEYKFFSQGRAMTVVLNHAPPTWPKEWVLKNVKMTHSKFFSRLLVVPAKEISMKW